MVGHKQGFKKWSVTFSEKENGPLSRKKTEIKRYM